MRVVSWQKRQVLDLSSNFLWGRVNASLLATASYLTGLQTLDLSNNFLTGEGGRSPRALPPSSSPPCTHF